MNILENRRSVRQFDLTKTIDDKIIEEILKTSMQAPSARNQQPWEFVVVKDKDTIARLSQVSKGTMVLTNANCVIVVVSKPLDTLSTPDMASQDLSIVSTYIMLSALEHKLGTCYLGIHPREDRIDAVNSILEIPNDYNAFSMIAIGYPKNEDVFKNLENRYEQNRIHKERF